eukprot:208708_1
MLIDILKEHVKYSTNTLIHYPWRMMMAMCITALKINHHRHVWSIINISIEIPSLKSTGKRFIIFISFFGRMTIIVNGMNLLILCPTCLIHVHDLPLDFSFNLVLIMSDIAKIDCMIGHVESELASSQSRNNQLSFFDVDEIEGDTLNDNHINYYFRSAYKPVVIRNGASHYPAIQRWKCDDFEYLRTQCGEDYVYIRRDTNCSKYRKGEKYKIERMPFKQYLNGLLANDDKSKSSYLAVTNIRYKLKNIIHDVPLCDFEDNPTNGVPVRTFTLFKNNSFKLKLHSGPHLWIAHRDHYEFTHIDPDDSMLCMIKGTKRVKLFAPHFIDGMHCNPYGSKGRTVQSNIDFTLPSKEIYERYNEFKTHGVFGYTVELNAGDILYIPAFWFHQVTSVNQSISINYFCGDYAEHDGNKYPLRIFGNNYASLKYWFLNIIEQNRNYKQFLSVIANLNKSVYNTFYKQWHDLLNKEQVDRMVEDVVEYLMRPDVRDETDIYYEFGDLRVDANLPQIPRNNPFIKIRGLLYRDD